MEGNSKQKFIDLMNIFHTLDVGRVSIFNPKVEDRIINYENSINLAKVEDNLKKGLYSSNYWNIIEDVTKCFEFILTNFISRTPIYKLAIDCKEIFDSKIDILMKSIGYCCGIWHTRKSRKIQCSGSSKKCVVRPNAGYFRYSSWAFCEKCFRKFPDTDIKLDEYLFVKKVDFKFCFYIDVESEDFIKCIKCKKLFHERCVLHIKQSGIPFLCNKCRIEEPDLKILKISSDQIAKTECDTYIENFLREHNIPNFDNIIVRMVSNLPTNFKTKPVIAKYHDKSFGNEIMYNNCVIFAFLKLSDGTEICFFGIYFQLYGNSKCPNPNKNSVYLSYIDSVKLCIVKERTRTYQYLLLGLFKYLKMKNFQKIFIWSCPPKRDVDYIFHEKPFDMKIPTKARLSNWYQKLMELSVEEHIVQSYSGIKKFADEEHWDDINNIPYMDSDMWPIRLEEAIVAAEKEAKISKVDIMMKINELMEIQTMGFDNQYFVLKLNSNLTGNKAELPEVIKGNWINKRNDLVDMFWENKLEYSNERLAKFSTMVVLYRMFLDDSICSLCGKFSNEGVNLFLLCNFCVEKDQKYNKLNAQINYSQTSIQDQSTSQNVIIIDDGFDSNHNDTIEIIDDIDEDEFFIDLTYNEENQIQDIEYFDLTIDSEVDNIQNETFDFSSWN